MRAVWGEQTGLSRRVPHECEDFLPSRAASEGVSAADTGTPLWRRGLISLLRLLLIAIVVKETIFTIYSLLHGRLLSE